MYFQVPIQQYLIRLHNCECSLFRYNCECSLFMSKEIVGQDFTFEKLEEMFTF